MFSIMEWDFKIMAWNICGSHNKLGYFPRCSCFPPLSAPYRVIEWELVISPISSDGYGGRKLDMVPGLAIRHRTYVRREGGRKAGTALTRERGDSPRLRRNGRQSTTREGRKEEQKTMRTHWSRDSRRWQSWTEEKNIGGITKDRGDIGCGCGDIVWGVGIVNKD